MNWKEIKKFIEKNKANAGLGDFDIIIPEKKFYLGGDLAEAITEVLEKNIELRISVEFFEKPRKIQVNTLLHELIHSRFCVYQRRVEEVTEYLEEEYINDMTKAVERIR